MKTRIEYLDTAKGIAIILICILHAVMNRPSNMDVPLLYVIQFISLFGVPLFIFINGMLYSDKYSRNPIKGYLAKFKAYYVPFLIYNLIYLALHNVFVSLYLLDDTKMGVSQFIKTLLLYMIGKRSPYAGAMWFLIVLFIVSVFFISADYMIKRLVADRYRVVSLSFVMLCLVIIGRVGLHYVYQTLNVKGNVIVFLFRAVNGSVIFYLGYLYKYYDINRVISKHRISIFLSTTIFTIIGTYLLRAYIISVITSFGLPIYIYIGSLVTCICGISMVLTFSQFKCIEGIKMLKTIGNCSLEIMALHFLAFKCVSYFIIVKDHLDIRRLLEGPVLYGYDGMWWLLYASIGCVLPVIFKLYVIAPIKKIEIATREGMRKNENSTFRIRIFNWKQRV